MKLSCQLHFILKTSLWKHLLEKMFFKGHRGLWALGFFFLTTWTFP